MTILMETDEPTAKCMAKQHCEVYKFKEKFLVKESDLHKYIESLLDEEFSETFD